MIGKHLAATDLTKTASKGLDFSKEMKTGNRKGELQGLGHAREEEDQDWGFFYMKEVCDNYNNAINDFTQLATVKRRSFKPHTNLDEERKLFEINRPFQQAQDQNFRSTFPKSLFFRKYEYPREKVLGKKGFSGYRMDTG